MAKSGYFQLFGENFLFTINNLSVILGRKIKNENNSLIPHIVLSESKRISREHARIDWNIKNRRWEITCLSKNCIEVDKQVILQSQGPYPIKSISSIRIGDIKFYFLLPPVTNETNEKLENGNVIIETDFINPKKN